MEMTRWCRGGGRGVMKVVAADSMKVVGFGGDDAMVVAVGLPEDVVNRILQVVLDLQHFKSSLSFSLFSSHLGVLTLVRGESLKILNGFDVSLPVSHSLWSSQSFGHQKAINGFDMPLPVAVCSGLVNPLAPRKGLPIHNLVGAYGLYDVLNILSRIIQGGIRALLSREFLKKSERFLVNLWSLISNALLENVTCSNLSRVFRKCGCHVVPHSEPKMYVPNAWGCRVLCFDKVVKKRTTSDAISADKNALEIQIKELRIDNDQLLNQIMSQEIMHIAVNYVDILDVSKSCVDECNKCLELETELLKKKDLIEKDVYDKLFKSFNTRKALHYELKAQSQEKDTIIRKLKDRIKSLSGKDSVENLKKDNDEIETINIELEHSVAKLLSKNENLSKEREHLKLIFNDQFDSIKKTCVRSKEHSDSLIAQINAKSVENSDLNAQLQEKVFAIATLKNELRKLKGKTIVNTAVSKPIATTLAPLMFKIDLEPLAPKLLNNKEAHKHYIKYTKEKASFLREIVEQGRSLNPLDNALDYACKSNMLSGAADQSP
ncbi:hypothetical protein Tco_0351088 [Tanacetum coccineum]